MAKNVKRKYFLSNHAWFPQTLSSRREPTRVWWSFRPTTRNTSRGGTWFVTSQGKSLRRFTSASTSLWKSVENHSTKRKWSQLLRNWRCISFNDLLTHSRVTWCYSISKKKIKTNLLDFCTTLHPRKVSKYKMILVILGEGCPNTRGGAVALFCRRYQGSPHHHQVRRGFHIRHLRHGCHLAGKPNHLITYKIDWKHLSV